MTNLKGLSENEVQVDDKLNKLLDYVKDEHAHFALAQTKLNNFSNNIEEIFTTCRSYMPIFNTQKKTTGIIFNTCEKISIFKFSHMHKSHGCISV